jgi:hypothetical protein
MTVASRSGDPTFLSAWAVGAVAPVDFTTSALPVFLGLPQTLDQLVAGERTAGVGISSGEVGTLSPVSLRTTALRERSRRIEPAWLAQEEGRGLISFGVVGCTFVRAFDKFPLMSQWHIHQRYFQ